ncbi:ribonuclease HII [Prochlorococcus sp. MIT 1341]|uniref:ribonuclease HII n=1 Tax=Prochlorococcus sp. MIT 1341 TaxID=3096221 RepID=UPI002A7502FE|nr:ribonuclease HII [Prochlorococcus sp. MIT 1341]
MLPSKKIIAGIDEVGRGSLFGPVFAGAVVLNNSTAKYLRKEGLTDSKLLTHKKRTYLVPLIKSLSIGWALGQASSREIDEFGIREATETAMIRAIQKLAKKPDFLLIDGNLPLRIWNGQQKNIIKGDVKLAEISAASVVAKESRDALIRRLACLFPGYGLETNMGYGTKKHIQAIQAKGASKLHRLSFLKNISE